MKRNAPIYILQSILQGEDFLCMAGEEEIYANQKIVRYSGKAKKLIESTICRIKKGQKIVGLRLDDGAWFVMPAGQDEWGCIQGVPDECVDMSNAEDNRNE